MTRKAFLEKLGIGAAFALTATCLGACTKDSLAPVEELSFEIDLADPEHASLLTNGGYIIKDQVVVAKSLDGDYVAATQICSHEGRIEVVFQGNEFFCTAHAARFDTEGNGLNVNGSRGLTTYRTELNGSILSVFSS